MESEQQYTQEISEAVKVVADANDTIVVANQTRQELVSALLPVAERMEKYLEFAKDIAVTREEDAKRARQMEKMIQDDVGTVKAQPILSTIIGSLYSLHRQWKDLENRFVIPLESARKAIRTSRIAWEEAERQKAEAEQRRLQAEADEKARKEREQQERLAKYQREKKEKARREAEEATRKAQAAKTEQERKHLEAEAQRKQREADLAAEKAAMREDNAQAVSAPVISIKAPKAMGGSRTVWVAEVANAATFFNALATNPQLQGFVEIKLNALAATRRNNAMFTVPGITFKQVRQ